MYSKYGADTVYDNKPYYVHVWFRPATFQGRVIREVTRALLEVQR